MQRAAGLWCQGVGDWFAHPAFSLNFPDWETPWSFHLSARHQPPRRTRIQGCVFPRKKQFVLLAGGGEWVVLTGLTKPQPACTSQRETHGSKTGKNKRWNNLAKVTPCACAIFDLLFLPAHGLRGEFSSLQVGVGSGNKSESPGASLNPGFAPSVWEEMDLWGLFGLCLTNYFPNQEQARFEQL